MGKIMAANWWKYGLCIFGGLGIGYVAGVRLTRSKADEYADQRIADIREMYRNERKAEKKEQPKEEESQKPEITTKTSIQTERLSEKKARAEEAENRYSKAFKSDPKPDIVNKDSQDDDIEDWSQYIHLVDEFPEDSTYQEETLKYYADGVVTYSVSNKKMDDDDIAHRIGEENLKLLDSDDCNEIHIRNDLYGIDYTIIFVYEEWAEVVGEEPYKAEI